MSTMSRASFAGRFAFLRVPAALALLAASTGAAHAQQGVSVVRGTVVDEQQGVLPGVTVVATHDESGRFQQTVTGASGAWFLPNLLPGPYTLSAELAGFNRFVREGVTLEVGVTTTIDVTMSIGALEETVTVSGEAPLVDLSSSQVGATSPKRSFSICPRPRATSPGSSPCCPACRSFRRPAPTPPTCGSTARTAAACCS